MKGYYTEFGYMGLVDGKYILFVNDSEYLEYITEIRKTEV